MTTQPTTFFRAFPAAIERTGARQLTGRLVPYGVVADVLDELPSGEVDIYKEGFRFAAFGPQANTRERGIVAKIGLIHAHDGGLGFLGTFTGLREQPDGLYGDVAVLRSKADDVEDLLGSGVDELSVEFRLPRAGHTEVDSDGVRWRTRAHLDRVALEPKGAYRSARVLAYRKEVDEAQAAEAEANAAQAAQAAEAERAEAAMAAEARRAEAEVEAAAERRRKFNELAGRLDGDLARQRELVAKYGFTQPGGNWT